VPSSSAAASRAIRTANHHPEKERRGISRPDRFDQFRNYRSLCERKPCPCFRSAGGRGLLLRCVFNKVWQVGKAGPFRSTDFSNNTKKFTVAGFPHTEVNFSPHDEGRAAELLDQMTATT
jgi:hypothetical protein